MKLSGSLVAGCLGIEGTKSLAQYLQSLKPVELQKEVDDLRHTWASWHRQTGTWTDELKDLGGWKSRVTVDRYAKYATEHLEVAAASIEKRSAEVIPLVTFSSPQKEKRI